MKNLKVVILLFFSIYLGLNAQVKLDDFGRIVINTYVTDNKTIPSEAKKALETKLSQITSNNGIGGSDVNPRFIITAILNTGTKDIVPGPPQMIAQNIEVTLFIGDAINNTIFSNVTLNLKGVGTNENKALIEAIKTINPKNKEVLAFLEEGKNKIITYYNTECDFILKNAESLVKQQEYDQAIYNLSLVPEVCKDCYFKSLDALESIYQNKIDAVCKVQLNEAKITWAAAQNSTGAEKAAGLISNISPFASCQSEVDTFIKSINAKLKADEKARWQFKMEQYKDQVDSQREQIRIAEEKGKRDDTYRENQSQRNLELDKIRVNSYREIAVEQAKNQPKTVTYNNIFWR